MHVQCARMWKCEVKRTGSGEIHMTDSGEKVKNIQVTQQQGIYWPSEKM